MLKQSIGSCSRSPATGRSTPRPCPAASPPATASLCSPSSPAPVPAPLCSSPANARRVLWPGAPSCPGSLTPRGATLIAAALPQTAVTTNGHLNGNGKSSPAAPTTPANIHSSPNGNGHSNGNGNGSANGKARRIQAALNGNGSPNGSSSSNGTPPTSPLPGFSSDGLLPDPTRLLRDGPSAAVRVHIVVPRCQTVPGEYLVLVGDCGALGNWDVKKGLRLGWCSGHMHMATFQLPADWQSLHAKLVLVHGDTKTVTWETGPDRSVVLQPPRGGAPGQGISAAAGAATGTVAGKGLRAAAAGTAAPAGGVSHDYVVVCHWGHTEATSVLAREVPGEVLVLEQQLSQALAELRTARNAAASSQDKLHQMAQDLANSERSARQSAEQLADLQAKHSAMATELTEAKRQAKAAAAEAATAAAAAAAAAKASSVNVAEIEARVSQRYEERMAELKQQLDEVKVQFSSERAALQERLEASLAKEVEAQEMVKTLREIVQKDVARLRAELGQLVNEYIAARQQLQEQQLQIEASEKLRLQQIDGLSAEIKNLIAKYNGAQNTIAEQQRMLDELMAGRGAALLPRAPVDPVAHLSVPPGPDPQAGRDWRSDWARLRKLTANGAAPATTTTQTR